MNYPVYFTVLVISFLASLTVYLKPRADKSYLRFFPLLLLITLIVESITVYRMTHGRGNTIIYNFFSSFEMVFYMYSIRDIIQNRKAKKIIAYSIGFYMLIAVLNYLYVQKVLISFTSITYSLACLMVVSFCIYYFYELFQYSHAVNLMRQSAFWICSGLLFFYTCSLPIYGFLNVLRKTPFILDNLRVIIFFLNVFLYSSFTIAFLCRLKTRKSTS